MFLVRAIFWLSIVIALIPVNPADLGEGQRPVSTFETLGAAQAVVRDLSGFCERNRQACETGSEVLAQFGAKARTGLRYVSAYLEEPAETGQPGDGQSDPIQTGTVLR